MKAGWAVSEAAVTTRLSRAAVPPSACCSASLWLPPPVAADSEPSCGCCDPALGSGSALALPPRAPPPVARASGPGSRCTCSLLGLCLRSGSASGVFPLSSCLLGFLWDTLQFQELFLRTVCFVGRDRRDDAQVGSSVRAVQAVAFHWEFGRRWRDWPQVPPASPSSWKRRQNVFCTSESKATVSGGLSRS